MEKIIKRDKTRIVNSLKQYKKIINQIFLLYNREEYRLCILSIINLLSIIYNNNFENTDFNEPKLKSKLTSLGLLDDEQNKFSIFAPYYVKERNDNKIIANYQSNPSQYKKYPYCRNAILHGYSIRFGNNRNTLRWFSVLLNTIDLLDVVEKINND